MRRWYGVGIWASISSFISEFVLAFGFLSVSSSCFETNMGCGASTTAGGATDQPPAGADKSSTDPKPPTGPRPPPDEAKASVEGPPPELSRADAPKFTQEVHTMIFNDIEAWKDGLKGFMRPPTRSIAEEMRHNCDGAYWPEFQYVVSGVAREEDTGEVCPRDQGHGGWALADFMRLEPVLAAKLTEPEVVVLRLYTGRLYAPWNAALRARHGLDAWATCVAVLYEAAFKMSLLGDRRATVYRGVDESRLRLPATMTGPAARDGFAGGVEPAFMSTTTDLAVAEAFAGGAGAPGTIFEFEFDLVSRGADLQCLSMYPAERELLWPPCTAITVTAVVQKGPKRMVRARASVSAARYDMGCIATVEDRPPAAVDRAVAAREPAWLFNCGGFPEAVVVHVLGGSAREYASSTRAARVHAWLRIFGSDGVVAAASLTPAICTSAESYGGTTFGCATWVTGYQLEVLGALLSVGKMHRLVEVDIDLRGEGMRRGVTFCRTGAALAWQMPTPDRMDEVCRVIRSYWSEGEDKKRGGDGDEWRGVTLTLRKPDGTRYAEYDPATRNVQMY